MAGESKGDNKLFQVMMVLITTFIAPVAVYFITHSQETPAKSAATLPPNNPLSSPVGGVSITASLDHPLFTPTVQLSTTTPVPSLPAAANEPTALPGVQNPQGILPSGDPGIVNGIAVAVLSKEVQLKDGIASIQIHVRNLTDQTQTVKYKVQSIIVKDTSGQGLDVLYEKQRDACTKKDLSVEKKIELAPDQEIILQSVKANNDMAWCTSEDGRFLPLYKVTTKKAPQSIVIQFNGFGPFKGFGFKIDF